MRKTLRTITLILLLAALLITTVFAAAGLQNFQEKAAYDGRFTDVPKSAWYYDSVGRAWSYGLVQGVKATQFSPNGNLTLAECVTLAARMHSIYHTGSERFQNANPWYQEYVDYAVENGMISAGRSGWNKPVTRGEFFLILAAAFPEEALAPINEVPDGAIPDLKSGDACYDAAYRLYRAGILNGTSALGEANPDGTLRRSEAAAILIRMAVSAQRLEVTLSDTITLYKPDGTSKDFPAASLAKMEKQGWYRYPVCTVYQAKTSKVVREADVEQYLKQGWSLEPFTALPSQFQSKTATGIPVISVSTGGTEVLSRENYVNCTVDTYQVPQSQTLAGQSGGIRVRGNSSSYYGNVSMIRTHDVPYRLKFDSKVNLLGLNDGAKCKSWVLLTNNGGTVDAVKNDIALRMGRAVIDSDGYYSSDGQLVNFFLNGAYKGVYLLCEQNQVNKNRVNVAEPEDGDTSLNVGYLVEIDNYSEEPYFRMNYEGATVTDCNGVTRTFRGNDYSVKSDTFSQAQVDFIAKYIRGVFQIVYQACEKGNYLTFDSNYNVVKSDYTNAKACISAVADVRSMADMYILYELMCDYDVGEGSFYMAVDFSEGSKFPKLTFTAPWDFEWTCSGSATGSIFAGAFRSSSFISSYGDRSNPWFIVLYKQAWFRELIKTRWAELGGSKFVASCIAEETALLNQYAADMNRKDSATVDASKANLNWIQKRANWLDTIWK